MPSTTKVKLGRDQVLTLDGVILEGVRELEFDITSKTMDVTSWLHSLSSTLVLAADISIRVLIYWPEDYQRIAAKYLLHPPEAMTMNITNFGTFRVVPENIRGGQPIDGVVSWEVTFKSYLY
jgi:hypothetical protein